MLRAILNKSWRQHPTRHQLYGHLPPITKTIQVRWTRHAGHCWRSRDELIRDLLLWTPTHGRAKAGRPARIYIQQLCEDTGCCPEDLPEAMNDREEWRERVRDIRATSTISLCPYPPYFLVYYAYKSKLYFLRNAKMMIICSLVRIITTHTHTHTHINTNSKRFLLGQTDAAFAAHPDSYILEKISNLPRGACILIHTLTKYHLYNHT